MKRIVFLLLVLILSGNLFSQKLFSIIDGEIVPAKHYSLYAEGENRNLNQYKLIGTDTFSLSGGYSYKIKAYQHPDDDYELWHDSAFSKLQIVCSGPSERETTFTFTEYDMFFRFNYWTFAQMTDQEWTGRGRELCKVIPLSGDCAALVFRGMHDSVGPGVFYVFVVYKNKAALVYRRDVEIFSMKSENNSTTLLIYTFTSDKDNDNKTQFSFFNMVFANGAITVEPTKEKVKAKGELW